MRHKDECHQMIPFVAGIKSGDYLPNHSFSLRPSAPTVFPSWVSVVHLDWSQGADWSLVENCSRMIYTAIMLINSMF